MAQTQNIPPLAQTLTLPCGGPCGILVAALVAGALFVGQKMQPNVGGAIINQRALSDYTSPQLSADIDATKQAEEIAKEKAQKAKEEAQTQRCADLKNVIKEKVSAEEEVSAADAAEYINLACECSVRYRGDTTSTVGGCCWNQPTWSYAECGEGAYGTMKCLNDGTCG